MMCHDNWIALCLKDKSNRSGVKGLIENLGLKKIVGSQWVDADEDEDN